MDVVIDFETSGLQHKSDYPIQVGMVGLKGKKVVFEYERFILPPQPAVARKTMWLTGISPETLLIRGYPAFLIYKEILRTLKGFSEDLQAVVFYAWNCKFDRMFMHRLETLAQWEHALSTNRWVELQPYPKANLSKCFSKAEIPAWFSSKFNTEYAHNGLVDCYRAIVSSPIFGTMAHKLDFSEVKRLGESIRYAKR